MEIKSRFSNDVIFKSEKETLKDSVEDAVFSRADLRGADLTHADLRGANLYGANLYGANLYGSSLYGADLTQADLRGANLTHADLRGANLYGANLYGANLYGSSLYGSSLTQADLRGANLYGANLYGSNLYGSSLYGADLSGANLGEGTEIVKTGRFIFLISPIGSRNSTLTAYNTNMGIMISTGCFFGSVGDFIMAVGRKHSGTVHFKDYTSAIEMIQQYFSNEVKP